MSETKVFAPAPREDKARTAEQYDLAGEAWHQQRGSGHELLEKPAMYAMLPDLAARSVLCIGCGYGEECAHLLSLGAASVTGIDLSEANIREAKKTFQCRELRFEVGDMEHLPFQDGSFDLVFSSLTIHYVSDWRRTLTEARRVLKPEGRIVLSSHHPASWGSLKDESSDEKLQLLGYRLDKRTNELQVYGNYLQERAIDGKFSGEFAARYFHKTLSSMLREFREAGLEVLDCQEPAPIPAAQQKDRQFWEVRSKFPLFILFSLVPNQNKSSCRTG